ncbi:MAG: hypothetical protein IJV11_01515 [Muribaculaceae bacterium]|nr:hypothetical protein [Muribaculaceae bacterium]
MKTTSHITIIAALIALLVPATASANVYEDRLKQAFDNIVNAVPLEDLSQMHNTYTDPETGVKEGQLDVYKFSIGRENMDLINNAKGVYEQLSADMENNLALRGEVYTLWWTNHEGTFQGYRLYYNPENTIIVGLACDYCYTVGLISPDNVKHRTTYTIEWDDATPGDSITGRLITTYAPTKPKKVFTDSDEYDKYMKQFQAGMEKYQEGMERYRSAMEKAQGSLEKAQGALSGFADGQSHVYSFTSSSKTDAQSWMKQLLFYVNKVQENGNRYLFLSRLYELCKDTEGLDQTDLKIGMQQLASIYKQLKGTNKLKENELLFLESMVDLLQSKIKK